MQFDNLLYGIFATSALQLLRADPENAQLLAARQHYFGLSIREHRKAVSQLCNENAESVLFASSLLLIDAFAALQDRPLQPYSPPTSWMNMARGVNSVFRLASAQNLMTPDTARLEKFLRVSPQLSEDDALFAEHERKDFQGLLNINIDNTEEPWNEETCMAYKRTLGYIGVVQMEAENGETQLENLRRVMAFPLLIPSKFIEFVEERRPRALAILAHFFALASKMENIWYLEEMAKREIGGIQSVLPDTWQHLIRIPVEDVGMTIV
jgi:hypothetical protein